MKDTWLQKLNGGYSLTLGVETMGIREMSIKAIEYLLRASGVLATSLLIFLVGVVSYNVIARYLFNASSIGLEELAWHLYASVFLLAIPYAVYTGSHVRIDLVYESRSEAYKRMVGILGCIVFLLPFALVTLYYGGVFTVQAFSYGNQPDTFSGIWQQLLSSDGIGEKSQDPGGLTNRFIIKAIIPLSALLLSLAGIRNILILLNTNSPQEAP
ncbi:MAG: TRAP transporter small permease subunit [Pseudomonadota bacterium]